MPVKTTIPVGAKGADFAAMTADIDTWLDANKARYVIRYIAGGGPWKHITPAEVVHHHAAKRAIVLNYEGSTSDYTGGALRGARNGRDARIAAQQLGYPEGLPLVVSVDTGLLSTSLPLAVGYVEAFFTAAAPYAPALYGPVNLYQKLRSHAPLFWLPNATSWHIGITPVDVVHVRQGRSIYPPGVDPNTTVTAFDAWLPTPDPVPPPKDDDMARYVIRDKLLGGAVYWADTLAPVGDELYAKLATDPNVVVLDQDHELTTGAFLASVGASVAVQYEKFRDSADGVND